MTEPTSITALAENTEHVAGGLDQLAAQFHGKAKVEALLAVFLTEVQAIETELWKMVISTGISAALSGGFSDALDQIGDLLCVGRCGLTDAEFAWVLEGAIYANKSDGTADDLGQITLGQSGFYPVLTEGYPASVLVDPKGPPVNYPSVVLLALLKRAKAAGVRLNLLDYPTGDLFQCSSTEFVEASVNNGFSNVGGLIGGKLVGVIE